ncbi:MAG: hypothetical protein JO144_08060 [Actinobacteria bacterium]|nr:hypothetical protein [Actinomycetota bacterium]
MTTGPALLTPTGGRWLRRPPAGPLRTLPTPSGLLRVARSAPLTCTVVLLAVVATVLLRTHPADLDDVVAWSSTNLHNLTRHPISALVASAFVIPGGLLPELALVAAGLLALERAVGTRSTLAVAAGGHVLATVLTEYGADLAGRLQLVAVVPDRPDVGISYLMFAVLGGAVVLRSGALRLLGSLLLIASVTVPFLLAPGLTTTGHLLSLGIGAGLGYLFFRRRTAARRAAST